MISFTIPGYPVAMQRPRFNRQSGAVYTPGETRNYQALVKQCAQTAVNGFPLLLGAVSLAVTCYRPPAKSWSKKRKAETYDTRKPDGDNLLKTIGDSLNGIVFEDDAQVAHASIAKKIGTPPRVEVLIRRLD